jgi:hypothetical protein
MPSFPGCGKDARMLAVPLIHRCRQLGGLLAGLGLILMVAWMTATTVAERGGRGAWEHDQFEDRVPERIAESGLGVGTSKVVQHGDRQLNRRFSGERAGPINPLLVDRSNDRRADLMDMATSLRWHRGTASGLPPGSD